MPRADELYEALQKKRWVVWIDRPADRLCVIDKNKMQEKDKASGILTEAAVIRVPLTHADAFIEGVINAFAGDADVADVLYASLLAADAEAKHWLELGTTVRAEFERRGAGVEDPGDQVSVTTKEVGRMRKLQDAVRGFLDAQRNDPLGQGKAIAAMEEALDA